MPIVKGDGTTGGQDVVAVVLGDGTTGGQLLTSVELGNAGTTIPIWPSSGPVPPAPTVDTNPVNQTKIVGETADFSASFTYSGVLTYQWEESTDGGSNWANSSASGNTTTAITFTTEIDDDQNQYRCVATDEFARSATTTGATLTVDNPPSGSQTFNNSGTFVVPVGVTSISISAVAGGGGGGSGCVTTQYGNSGEFRVYGTGGGGGAAGEQCVNRVYAVSPGQNISITIGAGGAGANTSFVNGGTFSGQSGGAGGNTVIGAPVSLTLRGGQAGNGTGVQYTGQPDWAYTVRATAGAGYSASSGNDGGNGGGQSGNGGSVNDSQRNLGLDEVKRSSTNASGRNGGSWADTSNVQTATGGGNGGSSQYGTGGLGAIGTQASGTSGYGDGGTGGVGCGGGGGGGTTARNNVNTRGGFGGAGGKGRVVISW